MLDALKAHFSGELYDGTSTRDAAMRMVYATDASVYQEKPQAVAVPRTEEDLKLLITYARDHQVTLIPRAAGTSLAGQVVGSGIVVDISRHFTKILEVNQTEKWVRVQPGVIRDDLNAFLRPQGLMFGPETSTSNRAMIGGMVGNNSSGLHSIVWGDTRQNLLELTVLLSDGSTAVFGELTETQFEEKLNLPTLEGKIYNTLQALLRQPENRKAIRTGFPKASITRRNTGYALDAVLDKFEGGPANSFNLSRLIAGSEGTLCLVTEAKLKLRDLPPPQVGMVAVHTRSIQEALQVNLLALSHGCSSSELVDDYILEFTKTNHDQLKNRFFIVGEPKAILMVEFMAPTAAEFESRTAAFVAALQWANLGFAFPVLLGHDANRAWDLRKAGLGLLRNLPGDTQPVNLIEDCAVDPTDLPAYIGEVETLLQGHGLRYSMYAHAGAGELHVEPMMNLKTTAGRALFRTVLAETAALVKKYRGSLSGEHGDGRLRGEFIPYMMGERNYALFQEVKQLFDPQGIFNKGKIVDTPPMNAFLRHEADAPRTAHQTLFAFKEGILHLAEKCSGSGDCRKTHVTGGTMCPSYMATRSERDTTRARANMLRHFYSPAPADAPRNVRMEEVKDVLDLCLSCKACQSECPSSVDVGKMKAEFTQQYYDQHGVPARARLIAHFTRGMQLASVAPWAYNALFGNGALRRRANRLVGFHPDRSMPALASTTLRAWWKKHQKKGKQPLTREDRTVHLFCDEFSNYNDVEVGRKLVLLLERLGYTVLIPEHAESGRTYLSKGLVREAQQIAIRNVRQLANVVAARAPLIGIEPSAILTFRDEYPSLVPAELQETARTLAGHTFLFEEWFAREIDRGNISAEDFREETRKVILHGHCHQKALSSQAPSVRCLSLPKHYTVEVIPSGCCGMAGSFGYEQEHYAVSMQIGELVLFPAVRQQEPQVLIAAPGTSCRHQIKDGTGRTSQHPAEILYDALK